MNASMPLPYRLDRRALARAFDRAGGNYEAGAALQRQVRQELLSRLDYFRLAPSHILDLGAGSCHSSLALQKLFPKARVLALDLAPGMLAAAPRAHWWQRGFDRICADACALPLAGASVDLIYSNLMLQWCDRPELVFQEIGRVLRSDGLLLFSSFGPDTLRELRRAWSSADENPHVSLFPDMPQLGAALMQAGLREPVMDVENHCLHYPDAHALMRSLKLIGARNAAVSRARGLTGRARLQRMIDGYEQQRQDAGLPATYEVIFGSAFGAAAGSRNATDGDGGIAVPLSTLRRSRR
jgi:malonyl-CoA O-methyltransferase